MTSQSGRQDVQAPNRLIHIVVSGEMIQPISDAEKVKYGFVDVEGRPKRAKVALLPSDDVKVIQLELYQQRHACDMCDSDDKSQRVVLLENKRTEQRFYAAGHCLRYLFGRDIGVFDKDSQLFRGVLLKVCRVLVIEIGPDDTTQSLVEAALPRTPDLQRFPCRGTDEVRALLTRIRTEPDRAAGGLLDGELSALSAFIDMHLDYARSPELHGDRWRALLAHPHSDRLSENQRLAVEAALSDPQQLMLLDFGELMAALVAVNRRPIPLRNQRKGLAPWDYPDRGTYQEALHRFYEAEPFNQTSSKYYSVIDQKSQSKLGYRLMAALDRDDRSPIVFWLSATAPSQVDQFGVLPNEDTLSGRGAQIVRTDVKPYFEDSGDPTSRKYRQGVCVFYFDRWYGAYGYWYKHRTLGGRDVLEGLQELGGPARAEVAPVKRDSSRVAAPGGDSRLAAGGAEAEAEFVLAILETKLPEVLGRSPTLAQLEALRVPVLSVYFTEKQGDVFEVARARERLEGVLVELGLAARPRG